MSEPIYAMFIRSHRDGGGVDKHRLYIRNKKGLWWTDDSLLKRSESGCIEVLYTYIAEADQRDDRLRDDGWNQARGWVKARVGYIYHDQWAVTRAHRIEYKDET